MQYLVSLCRRYTVRSGKYHGGKLYTDDEYAELVRSAAIKPHNGRQSLEEALKEAGFSFEEDMLGIERPDGKKRPAPKEAQKKPLKVPHFDDAQRDTNAPFAHPGASKPEPSGSVSSANKRTRVLEKR